MIQISTRHSRYLAETSIKLFFFCRACEKCLEISREEAFSGNFWQVSVADWDWQVPPQSTCHALPLAGTAGWRRHGKAWGGQGAGGTTGPISGCPLGLHSLAAGLLTGKASKSCPVLFVSEPVSPQQCRLEATHVLFLIFSFFFFFLNEVTRPDTSHLFPAKIFHTNSYTQ